MWGFVLGLACGGVECFLLRKLTGSVSEGKSIPFWIVPAKMAALALFLVPCGLFFADQLHWAAAGAVSALIAGAAILSLPGFRKKAAAIEPGEKRQ